MGKPIPDRDRDDVLTVEGVPDWVLRFYPDDWRDDDDEPYPGTFEGDEDRWRAQADVAALERRQDPVADRARRHLAWRALDNEARRRWPAVDHIPHTARTTDDTARGSATG